VRSRFTKKPRRISGEILFGAVVLDHQVMLFFPLHNKIIVLGRDYKQIIIFSESAGYNPQRLQSSRG
jgi:hypothetical protein